MEAKLFLSASATINKMHRLSADDGDPTTCKNPSCFFCTMSEPDPSLRRSKLAKAFRKIPLNDDPQNVLVLSGLWNIAMAQPDDPEFGALGLFECMAKLILRGISDRGWLLRDQNVYIPYYAAHIIGSYVMNKALLAEKAVRSGVVLTSLMELMRGKMSWVEQRVAVRALGHLASHEKSFEAVLKFEQEIVELAMEIASDCMEVIYDDFISVKGRKRVKYHVDLVTRGLGGKETEDAKAEEWASQLRGWSLYLLCCFACRERSVELMCKREFLRDLCGMWGGLANRQPSSSPTGVELIRTLCQHKIGRRKIANCESVTRHLCNLSRSSDDEQQAAIDVLLLLLKDPDTRYQVLDIAVVALADLIELGDLGDRITQVILRDYHKFKYGDLKLSNVKAQKALEDTWYLKVERRRREKLMSAEEVRERKMAVALLKKQGNESFWRGDVETAITSYTRALDLCPLKMSRQRVVIHSNRAQCHLLMRNPEAAISDATRAVCLSSAASPHSKSLWRRSQAYDMRGLARESLMDCLVFVHGRIVCEQEKGKKQKNVSGVVPTARRRRREMIPYYAARLMNKQMNATSPFANIKKNKAEKDEEEKHKAL